MNNKGFSLVELIIVIAIMAILAGAIAPALIRYIDKSRISNDVSSCKTIKTAVETAMANEKTYELLTNSGKGSTIVVSPDTETSGGGGITLLGSGGAALSGSGDAAAKTEIGANIGEKTPKIKYKKLDAKAFVVEITPGGTVKVGMSTDSKAIKYEVAPELCEQYQ